MAKAKVAAAPVKKSATEKMTDLIMVRVPTLFDNAPRAAILKHRVEELAAEILKCK